MWAVAVSAALAMGLRVDDQLVAWSDAGDAALVERRTIGPEGGGALAYVIVRLDGGVTAWVVETVSSDLSPGDGSTPQRVSVVACETAADHLRLGLDGFGGVDVDGKACAGDRGGVVRVAGRVAKRAAASWLPEVPRDVRAARAAVVGPLLLAFPEAGGAFDAWRKGEGRWVPAPRR